MSTNDTPASEMDELRRKASQEGFRRYNFDAAEINGRLNQAHGIPYESPPPAPSEGVGELIERLIIANLKLWAVCEEKAALASKPFAELADADKERLHQLGRQDVTLCKSRAAIRAELNRRLGSAESGESIKVY